MGLYQALNSHVILVFSIRILLQGCSYIELTFTFNPVFFFWQDVGWTYKVVHKLYKRECMCTGRNSKSVFALQMAILTSVTTVSIYLPALTSYNETAALFSALVQSRSICFRLGMGWYQKCIHWEVTNAKPYRFQDSTFQYTPQKTQTFPVTEILTKSQNAKKYEINS